MENELKATILEGAKAAFFEAMLDGYAGGENRRSVKVKGGDGYTTIIYTTEDGRYKVEDRYCTTPFSDKSAGTTTILYRFALICVPVWWMEYSGSYPSNIIPLLKSALCQSYKAKVFKGGRGPENYPNSGIKYTNAYAGDFERFEGREEIVDQNNDKFFGFHNFSGRSLI